MSETGAMNDQPKGEAASGIRRFRSIFISDFHLGTPGSKAKSLLHFLENTDSERLYLVGDIIDGWRLKKVWYWPDSHQDVVQAIIQKAQNRTDVILLPGNHDENFRNYLNGSFGNIPIQEQCIFQTADHRRFLVLHGDQFDMVVQHARWLAVVGDYAYRFAMGLNAAFNWVRRRFGLSYWSLSAYLKAKVKKVVSCGTYEKKVSAAARKLGVNGVICGHIHRAEIQDFDGITYINDGDWVESCTALVEHDDGSLEILCWKEIFDESAENQNSSALRSVA